MAIDWQSVLRRYVVTRDYYGPEDGTPDAREFSAEEPAALRAIAAEHPDPNGCGAPISSRQD